ncbi:MAG TPA: magnesium transporter [Vicinamibacterales bacterium]
MHTGSSEARLQQALEDVTRLLERHRVLDSLTHRQEGPKRDLLEQLQHRQNVAELQSRIRGLHPADLAHVLDALPPHDRLLVWEQVEVPVRGDVLLEVSDAVREALIEATPRDLLVSSLSRLDADDIAFLADDLPDDVLREVSRNLDARERTWLQASMAYGRDSVAALMSPEVLSVREDQTIEEVLAYLRTFHQLPPQTDRLFVVDSRNVLRGELPIEALLLTEPKVRAGAVMRTDFVSFQPDEEAEDAAKAFERYDLVSAPVTDERGKLLGRLTVEAVMDYNREEAEQRALESAGLRGEEDLFASTWASAKNRWPWLFVNLVTAFVASRVIGLFEDTIQQLVALAALMPIVASVGGNTGNQTIALVVRGIALDQIHGANTRYLVHKEVMVSLLNGVMWGGLMGLFAWLIYGHFTLGLVMTAAMVLNLLVAALVGIAVPLVLERVGRDPAQGASVLLTFTTDSMGFLLFLGLAKLFLV